MKIKLQYFKASGKYYSEGTMEVPDDCTMWNVFDKAQHLKDTCNLPDLIQGSSGFTVLVTGEGHPLGFPAILK